MEGLRLPKWAKAVGPGKVEVQAAEFYPEWLALLGVAEAEITQYDLECAHQCMKLDIQLAAAGTDFIPDYGALVIIVKDTTKAAGASGVQSKWAQCRYPEGKGAGAARGGVVKELFRKIRKVPLL